MSTQKEKRIRERVEGMCVDILLSCVIDDSRPSQAGPLTAM